ncbi:hypothetical protein GQ53DRAFT_134182 [Thozetella sp. PMI_491]|nr:hypothetical protein GQ53DRAFT_134182 [Thozetella sp. PMI_491]
MKLTIIIVACISTLAGAIAIENPEAAAVRREILLLESRGVNEGRAVASGACCIAEVSKKEDVCNVNGAAGKCVPANSAGCGAALTCIANAKLSCNNNVLENGKPTCRPTA